MDEAVNAAVSRRMAATRGVDTLAERRLRSELHRRGLRFRKNARPEPSIRRSADVLFTRAKVAVFVDGCFWHGCPEHYVEPKTRTDFWATKIGGNRARDVDTTELLSRHGWIVVRVWEHEPVPEAAERIAERVRSQVGAT